MAVSGCLSEVRVPVTLPESLAVSLRRLAERDCSSVSATVRRLIARGVEREFAQTQPQQEREVVNG
jgi:metal-responsive CopG/Arc/MetJ family transcriptional regulator